MNDFALMRKNLFRKRLRAALMIVSILIAFLIFGVVAGFYRAFTWGQNQAAADRLIVINKINFTLPLPVAYFDRVRAVDGVRQATYASWFGGYYQDPKNVVAAMAVDPETYFDVYAARIELSQEALQAFRRDRTAALVGEDLARQKGWKVGDHIPISSNVYSQRNGSRAWDFTVVGLVRGRTAEEGSNFLLFQYAYFDETRLIQKNTIGWMVLQTSSPAVTDRVAKAIDQMFANSAAETASETEQVFSKAFAAQVGNIALIVTLVIGAAFVTILMIVGNTMALTIRERTREIGVLKTLGFSGGRILGLVLGESILLALLGGLPGIALAQFATMVLRRSLGNVAPTFTVTPAIALSGLGLMLALGIITGLLPAVNAMRLRIATALGRG